MKMEDITLKIQPKRYREESVVVSMRLPEDMLCEIDRIAKQTGRTRNEIMTTGLEFALEHMDTAQGDEKSQVDLPKQDT